MRFTNSLASLPIYFWEINIWNEKWVEFFNEISYRMRCHEKWDETMTFHLHSYLYGASPNSILHQLLIHKTYILCRSSWCNLYLFKIESHILVMLFLRLDPLDKKVSIQSDGTAGRYHLHCKLSCPCYCLIYRYTFASRRRFWSSYVFLILEKYIGAPLYVPAEENSSSLH